MEANSGFSVALHVKGVPPSGRSPENSVYVSTTDDPLVAAKFLRGEKGYVYKIRAVPRMFSVAGTLQKYYDYPFPVSNQREWVAMGGVSWDQIESAAFIKPTDSGVVAPDTKFNWKANRAFARGEYSKLTPDITAGAGRPELAGFDEIPKHPGSTDPLFRDLQSKRTLKEYGVDYLKDSVKAEKGLPWDGQGPLLKPVEPKSGSRSRGRVCVISKRDGSGCQLRARSSAAKRYDAYARKHGLAQLATRKNRPLSFATLSETVSSKFGGKLGYRAKLAAAKGIGGAVGAVSLGIWAKSVSDIFSTESSALERVAVTTSLIPVVGCVTQGASDSTGENARNSVVNGIDTAVCIVADVLAFIPGGGTVSFALHLARSLFRILESLAFPKEPPPIEKTYFQYRWGWDQYFYHMDKMLSSSEFKGNLTSQLIAAKADVLLMAAEAAGTIDATLSIGAANETEGVNQGDSEAEDDIDIDESDAKPDAAPGQQSPPEPKDGLGKRDGEGEPIAPNPSDGDNQVPDLEPLICKSYNERKKQIFQNLTAKLEGHMEEAYTKYDLEFFNNFHPWLYRFLRQHQPFPSVEELERKRDTHIEQVMKTYARDDSKPGLSPGPGANRLGELLQIVFDDVTRNDICKEPKKPPMIDGAEVLPGVEIGGDLPEAQRKKEEQEGKWRDELQLVSLAEKENKLKDAIWAQVRQEIWQMRVQSGAWPPREGSDAVDPARDFDKWARFDQLMKEAEEREQRAQGVKPSTPGNPGQNEDTSKDNAGSEESQANPPPGPTGSNVLLCASGGHNRPCLEAKTTPGHCVPMPPDWNDHTSSIRLNQEAGACNFYTDYHCAGAQLNPSAPGVDLLEEQNRNFDNQISSYRCAAETGTAEPSQSHTLFVAKTYAYKSSAQECIFYFETSTPDDGNWIGIFKTGQTPGTDQAWSWSWAKSGSGSANVNCAGLGPGYQAYLVGKDGNARLQGPMDL